MITYLQTLLGNYTPLTGDGIASLNIEYITAAIILISILNLTFKIIYKIILKLFNE